VYCFGTQMQLIYHEFFLFSNKITQSFTTNKVGDIIAVAFVKSLFTCCLTRNKRKLYEHLMQKVALIC
jgi:hypothetical protein